MAPPRDMLQILHLISLEAAKISFPSPITCRRACCRESFCSMTDQHLHGHGSTEKATLAPPTLPARDRNDGPPVSEKRCSKDNSYLLRNREGVATSAIPRPSFFWIFSWLTGPN